MTEKKKAAGKTAKVGTLKRKSVRASVANIVKGGSEPINGGKLGSKYTTR